MGKSSNQDRSLTIQFARSRRVYQAGDTVTGSVIYTVKEQKSNANLELKMSGRGSVAFTRDTGAKRRERFFCSEYYLEKHLQLWPQGSGYGGPSPTLGPGRHEFPFTFRLPQVGPSSFHCSSGNVRYYLKAKLNVGRKSISTKEFFIFYEPLRLDRVSKAMLPLEQEEDISLLCACCASGKVFARVRLPKRAFVPGETIVVDADLVNNSSARITKTYFVIEQIAHCHAQGKTDTLRKELNSGQPPVEHRGMSPGGSDKWNGEAAVRVPVTVPSGLTGSSIIDVEHQLALYVVPAGMACTMRMGVNIVIGTVPASHSDDTPEAGLEEVEPSFGSGRVHGRGSRGHHHEHSPQHPVLDRDLTWESRFVTTEV